MLQITDRIQNATRRRGRNLARLSKGQRAAAAAALVLNKAPLVPTIRLAADACRVSVTYTRAALAASDAERAALAAGTIEIVELLPKRNLPSSLAEHLVSSTADEKVEAAKALGVDVVWDQMVLPLIA